MRIQMAIALGDTQREEIAEVPDGATEEVIQAKLREWSITQIRLCYTRIHRITEEPTNPDWVIEIESVNGPCYVNEDMDGDPGRTHDPAKAERYATENEAQENYSALCRKYPGRKFKRPVRLTV